MKGYLRIGGALLFGAVIIAVGLFLRPAPNEGGGLVSVASAPERQYIPSYDTNGNGIRDWEEELQNMVFENAAEPVPTVAGENETYTDKFARSFFEDFIDAKLPGAPPENKEDFINNAVTSIEKTSQSRIYTKEDIPVIVSSDLAIRNYGNAIADIISKHAIEKEDEGLILSRALENNDPEMLKELGPIKTVYELSLKETLLVPVPDSLVTEHLNILNAYQAMYDDINAMEMAFVDPLYTLARLKRYEDDAVGIYLTFVNMSKALTNAGAIYADDEPGVLFRFFLQP